MIAYELYVLNDPFLSVFDLEAQKLSSLVLRRPHAEFISHPLCPDTEKKRGQIDVAGNLAFYHNYRVNNQHHQQYNFTAEVGL